MTVDVLNYRPDGKPVVYANEQGYDIVVLPKACDVARLWGAHEMSAVFLIDSPGTMRLRIYKMLMDSLDRSSDLTYRQEAQRRASFRAPRLREPLDRAVVMLNT